MNLLKTMTETNIDKVFQYGDLKVKVGKNIVNDIALYDINTGLEITMPSWMITKDWKEVVDWNILNKGTKVQVRNSNNEQWENRYFLEYKDGYYWVSLIADDSFVNLKAEEYKSKWTQCRMYEE